VVSADDRVLALQQAVDRAIRRLRRGAPPQRAQRRRLLIVQIDGLSRAMFQHALESGRLPFVRRLLRERRYEM
jgi:nicotinamide riboside kinase